MNTDNVAKDWDSAEHLSSIVPFYNYCLALDYNSERIPGKGSAVFLHCMEPDAVIGTGGCVKIPEEENPFLGYRAIRLCLDRREELLLPQLRAILRAGVNKNVRIMLPMITSLEEFQAGKAAVEEAGRALEAENIPFAGKIPVGMMVETPAAALMADVFAREADFFSIGTNDLIQYTMAVDRGNELVASLYSPFQPAVLRSIRRIAAEGGRAGIPVGMCGEAASDPRLAPLFLAFGITELSMAPAQVLRMKEAITRLDLGKAEECIKRVLSAATAAEVLKIMEECW